MSRAIEALAQARAWLAVAAQELAPHLVCNYLSDLAAKGARPLGYLLALMLPSGTKAAWLARFAAGLRADQQEFGLPLLGGDLTRTPGPPGA